MLVRLFVFLLAVLAYGVAAQADQGRTLKICIEDAFWAPHTFMVNGKPDGIHVRLLQQAAGSLNYQLDIIPLPWMRCFKRAEIGSVDAILSATYTKERAKILDYPNGATSGSGTDWRVTLGEEVVVVGEDSNYRWDGDLRSLPTPVGSKVGYRITQALQNLSVSVVTTTSDQKLFAMLQAARVHSLIAPRGMAEFYAALPKFYGQFKIDKTPVTTIPYFLAVAKKGTLSNAETSALWRAIVAAREDADGFAHIEKETISAMKRCLSQKAKCH